MTAVSVIIPCFNQGHFLDEAVTSVLNQTFRDFEIIVVDDGSDDPASVALLEDYRRERTRVVHTTNQGLAAARNNGIRAAAGTYILPLDADDRIGETYLEAAVRVLERDPEVGIVYCDAAYFGEREGLLDLPPFEMDRMLTDNIIFCSALFRRKDWECVGGYNPNMVHGWEDWDFWLSILETGRRVHRIPRVLFHYRAAEDSMIGRMSPDKQHFMRLTIRRNHPDLYRNIGRLDLTPRTVRLYLDTGRGFRERETVTRVISGETRRVAFDIGAFAPVGAIRLDPVNDRAALRVIDLRAYTAGGREVPLREYKHNAFHRRGTLFFFTSDDPWIVYHPEDGGVARVELEIEYLAFGTDTYRRIIEEKEPLMLEQSEQIRSQAERIVALNHQLEEKDAVVRSLREELETIRTLPLWRLMAAQIAWSKALATLRKEGFAALWARVRRWRHKG